MIFIKYIKKIVSKAKSLFIKLYDLKTSNFTELSITDLFFLHSRNGEFLRYDTVVRYITIERYFQNHPNSFELYSKMQNPIACSSEAKLAVALLLDVE